MTGDSEIGKRVKRKFVRPQLVDYGVLHRITMSTGEYTFGSTAAGGYYGFGNKKIIER